MLSALGSPAASRPSDGQLILHPQQPLAVDSRLSSDVALHALLSGRASRECMLPAASFALHQRDSKASLAFVAHPLAWSSAAAAASSTPAISAAHAHYSASELPLPLHSLAHVHRDDDWRLHAHSLPGLGAGPLGSRSAASRGIVPRFAQAPRIIPSPEARTIEEQYLASLTR